MGRRRVEDEKAGLFFWATLVLWSVSLCFEILFNRRYELVFVALGCFFFQTANYLVRRFASRDPLFVNTSVSLLHSTIISSSVVLILVNQWVRNGLSGMLEHSRLLGDTWAWAYAALGFSCGYFAYDQFDMLRHRLYTGFIPPILVHHLLLLICFTLALYRRVAINYLILTLICELHSVFLHVRKVRRMAGFRNTESIVVKVEWILNWITFIVARLASHIFITVKLVHDAPKFGNGIELPIALFGMAGMNLLNIFLGVDLFNAFKREKSLRRSNRE